MAFGLPILAVTGELVAASWGNATRDSLAETAPAKAAAKGDSFWATGANAIEVLTAGANGKIIAFDSAQSGGVKVVENIKQVWANSHALEDNSVREQFLGDHAVDEMPDNLLSKLYFTIPVPSDFDSLVSLDIVLVLAIAGGNNLRWSALSDYGAAGEGVGIHDGAIGGTTTGLATGYIEIDVSALVASLAAGDYLGVVFLREGADVLDTLGGTLYMLGLKLEYRSG